MTIDLTRGNLAGVSDITIRIPANIIVNSSDKISIIGKDYTMEFAPNIFKTSTMEDNKNVYGSINVTVLDSETEDDIYNILINPDINYVLEGETISITANLYKNGIKQDNMLTIVDVSENVPRQNYRITIKDNTFTIENKQKYLKDKVKIQCSYNNELFEVFEFTLRGLY